MRRHGRLLQNRSAVSPGGRTVTDLIIVGLAVVVAYVGSRFGYDAGYGDAVNGVPHW
jgi:hypothetical protein